MPQKDTQKSSFNSDPRLMHDLSELVDGEFDGNSETLLNKISGDDHCKAAWNRYHIMRDVMQRDYHPAINSDFTASLSRQIAQEDVLSVAPVETSNVAPLMPRKSGVSTARQARRPRRAWQPVAGLGLAASVAAAGFVVWQLTGQQTTDLGVSVETAQINVVTETTDNNTQPILLVDAVAPAVYKQEPGTRWMASTSEPRNAQVEQRLNSLLLSHQEDSTMGQIQGMLAHSRVVAYDSVPVNDSF